MKSNPAGILVLDDAGEQGKAGVRSVAELTQLLCIVCVGSHDANSEKLDFPFLFFVIQAAVLGVQNYMFTINNTLLYFFWWHLVFSDNF